MSLFLVALVEPDEGAWISIQTEWPNDHRIIHDTLAFVVDDGVKTASDISRAIGIHPSIDDPTGIVVEVMPEQISGALPSDLAHWIIKAHDRV